jgi:hypothetical protein
MTGVTLWDWGIVVVVSVVVLVITYWVAGRSRS